MKLSVASSLVLVSAVVLSACGAKHDDTSSSAGTEEAVSGGTETAHAESSVESLSSSFISGGGTGAGALSVGSWESLTGGEGSGVHVEGLGDVAKGYYLPAGCLTVMSDGASQATYTFADCTGPYGLVHVTGTVKLTYSVAGDQLSLAYSATGLKVNRHTVDWDATATVTAGAGGARTMDWKGHFTGTTAGGRAFERTNQKTYGWTVGGACLTVTGSSDGTVTGKELKTDVISWSQCKGSCPAAGSEIKITNVADGNVYDVKYGDASVTYTGPRGSVTFKPLCAY
jgi:hypothetical protein